MDELQVIQDATGLSRWSLTLAATIRTLKIVENASKIRLCQHIAALLISETRKQQA